MTPTITQSRKRVIECEILRRLMRLRMTSCDFNPLHSQFPHARDCSQSRPYEETRSNDSAMVGPLSKTPYAGKILGPSNLVAIHILFIVSSPKSLSSHERSPTGPAHEMGFGNDEGTCIGR